MDLPEPTADEIEAFMADVREGWGEPVDRADNDEDNEERP